MSQFDPEARADLEAAAKELGLRLVPSGYDSFAIVEGAKHHTADDLLSGKPILFGRLMVDGKPGYFSISYTERDGREYALVKNRHGNVVAEHHARIMVSRLPNAPDPKFVIGGPRCWLMVRERDGCLQVHVRCGGIDHAWSSCD